MIFSTKTRNRVFQLLMLSCAACLLMICGCNNSDGKSQDNKIGSLEEYRKLRSEKLNQSRPLFYDNDGNDVIREEFPIDTTYFMYPAKKEFSVSTFLHARTTPLKGSDVSTIAYCTLASGFGNFTHRNKAGVFYQSDPQHPFPDSPTTFKIRTVIPDLIKIGTDPLEVICKYAHENNLEVFWSNRMNDTHDKTWDSLGHPSPLWPKFKADHPEYLFGKPGQNVPYGAWSAVDFGQPEVRSKVVQFFTEVCENFDVDGIELDFFRHLHLFKNVAYGETASAEEIKLLTDMVSQIREMTEKVGMKKGKPILVAVRVPDSFDYCRAIGMDLEGWMKDGLVDIVIGTCYFRLNPLDYFISAGHKYNVKIYGGLSESRIQQEHPLLHRRKSPGFRARAAACWQAGVDGLYSFDQYNPAVRYLFEIGNAEKLKNKNNLYFVTDMAPVPGSWNSPSGYLKDGNKFSNLPLVTPEVPTALDSAKLSLPIELGDESNPAKISVLLYTRDADPKLANVSLNGHPLAYRKSDDKGLSVYEVPADAIKTGKNELAIDYQAAGKKATGPHNGPALLDASILFYRDSQDQDISELANFCYGK